MSSSKAGSFQGPPELRHSLCLCVCVTQGVEVGLLVSEVGPQVGLRLLGMLLLVLTSLRIFVPEDQVQLVVLTTLVWAKHNGVGGLVLEQVLEGSKGGQEQMREKGSNGCWYFTPGLGVWCVRVSNQVQVRGLGQQLDIGSSTINARLEVDLIPVQKDLRYRGSE